MLKYYVKTTESLKRLRADQDGVVSFEYIIVATCIVAVVIAVFQGTGAGSVSALLTAGVGKISSAMAALQ